MSKLMFSRKQIGVLVAGVSLATASAFAFVITGDGSHESLSVVSITVEEVTNRVEVEIADLYIDAGDKEYVDAYVGLRLSKGDSVKTFQSSEARVDIAIDDTVRFMRTTPNTLWRVGTFVADEGAVIELHDGRVLIFDEETPEGRPPLQIITPAGNAVARGTWMSVEVDVESGETSVQCFRGSCELTNEIGTLLLSDQQKSSFTERTLPKLPTFMSPGEEGEFRNIPEAKDGTVPVPESTNNVARRFPQPDMEIEQSQDLSQVSLVEESSAPPDYPEGQTFVHSLVPLDGPEGDESNAIQVSESFASDDDDGTNSRRSRSRRRSSRSDDADAGISSHDQDRESSSVSRISSDGDDLFDEGGEATSHYPDVELDQGDRETVSDSDPSSESDLGETQEETTLSIVDDSNLVENQGEATLSIADDSLDEENLENLSNESPSFSNTLDQEVDETTDEGLSDSNSSSGGNDRKKSFGSGSSSVVASPGPVQAAVPDVVGLDQSAAESVLLAAGLLVGTVATANDPVVPAGDVMSSNPTAGTSSDLGSKVDFVVSLGTVQVAVPDVVGFDQSSAESAVLVAGLLVGTVATASDPVVPAGDVISSNPTAGTSVDLDSKVDIIVSLGPVHVVVPDVVGFDQSSAQAAIVAVSLTVGTVATSTDPVVPAGDIVSQNPSAGTNLDSGSSVGLVVSVGPVQMAVPDVVGLDQSTAESAILAAGLLIGTVATANDPVVPAGDVTSSNPTAGTSVDLESKVNLVVSIGPVGPAQPVVPDVVGFDQSSAQAAIVAVNLTVGNVTTSTDPVVPAGDVISQNPPAGTNVDSGSSVDLVVSEGPVQVPVPDVVGLDQSAAESVLLAAGLLVGTVATASDPVVPAGDVISSNPTAGTNVDLESKVDLVVSLGPVQVVVPDVVGFDQSTAQSAIVAVSLTVGTVATSTDPVVPAGDVISQNPPAGTNVDSGSSVDLVVSVGPVQVAVPDVVALDQSAAESALLAAGLLVGTVATANDPAVPAGDVISSNPTAGTNVDLESKVDIVVSLGPT